MLYILMLYILVILGWLALNACVALGVAIACDRLLGTFSTPQRAPLRTRVSPGERGRRPIQKEKTDV